MPSPKLNNGHRLFVTATSIVERFNAENVMAIVSTPNFGAIAGVGLVSACATAFGAGDEDVFWNLSNGLFLRMIII